MLWCHIITYVSCGKNKQMRAEHAFLPPKALHLLTFLSVSNFLARLRKLLLTLHAKFHLADQLLGHNAGTNSPLIVLL